MNVFKLRTTLGLTVAAALSVFASAASAESLVAINTNNQISVFDSSNTLGAIFNPIIGAAAGKSFIGIDLRPTNNTIYGITTSNEIYTLDAYTGNSSFVAALSSNIVMGGKSFGIDFNPRADRGTGSSLRVVSSKGDNYAVNVNAGLNAGAVLVQTDIAKDFTAISYTNTDARTPSVTPANTALYYINSKKDTLSFASSAFDNPTINLIGSLGVDVKEVNGFDILSNGTSFAAFKLSGKDDKDDMDDMDDKKHGLGNSYLFNINLATGQGTQLGQFNSRISGLTIAPVPEPETYAMLLAGLGLIGAASRRKNK